MTTTPAPTLTVVDADTVRVHAPDHQVEDTGHAHYVLFLDDARRVALGPVTLTGTPDTYDLVLRDADGEHDVSLGVYDRDLTDPAHEYLGVPGVGYAVPDGAQASEVAAALGGHVAAARAWAQGGYGVSA